MVQWLRRITLSDEVAKMISAGECDKEVDFTYINTKTGKETTCHGFSIQEAVLLAESRREDGRYKNFEFHIG